MEYHNFLIIKDGGAFIHVHGGTKDFTNYFVHLFELDALVT